LGKRTRSSHPYLANGTNGIKISADWVVILEELRQTPAKLLSFKSVFVVLLYFSGCVRFPLFLPNGAALITSPVF